MISGSQVKKYAHQSAQIATALRAPIGMGVGARRGANGIRWGETIWRYLGSAKNHARVKTATRTTRRVRGTGRGAITRLGAFGMITMDNAKTSAELTTAGLAMGVFPAMRR